MISSVKLNFKKIIFRIFYRRSFGVVAQEIQKMSDNSTNQLNDQRTTEKKFRRK